MRRHRHQRHATAFAMTARRKAGTRKYTRMFSRHFHLRRSFYSFAIIHLHLARLRSREGPRDLDGNRGNLPSTALNALTWLVGTSDPLHGRGVPRYRFLNAWIIIRGNRVTVNRSSECKHTDVDAQSVGNGWKVPRIRMRASCAICAIGPSDISAIFLYSPRVRVGSG